MGIEYRLERVLGKISQQGHCTENVGLNNPEKKKARICFCKKRLCEAASGIAGKCRTHRPYPATPDRL